MENLKPREFISYGPSYKNRVEETKEWLKKVEKAKEGKSSFLISGDRFVGKTSFAAFCAEQLNFPYTKIVTCDKIYSLTENQKISYLLKVFEDSKRCKQSCIILDDLLRLIQFIPLGNKYNNSILQLIMNFLKAPKIPNKTQILISTSQNKKVLQEVW